MTFYTALSNYYDDIFKTNHHAISLINKVINSEDNSGKTLLDIGAGTGKEATVLARQGYKVTATDICENMVQIIKEKALSTNPRTVSALTMDMNDMAPLASKKFNGILCIGNTFAHLLKFEDMLTFLNNCFSHLKKNGSLIIQIVNYDRILKKNITELPPIINEAKGIQFYRYYEPNNQLLTFRTKLVVNGKTASHPIELQSETLLYPLCQKDFVSLLEKSKFNEWKLFGGFNFEEWTPDSPATVAVIS